MNKKKEKDKGIIIILYIVIESRMVISYTLAMMLIEPMSIK